MESRKWALLIGIDYYDRATPLRFARADARAMASSLEETCGFSRERIRLLVDGAGAQEDVSHTGIIGALETMAALVQPEDTFLFYFAGHGITRDDQSYLLGANADLSSSRRVQMTSVPMPVLRDAIAAIPAREKVLILDACRNDPAAGRADSPNRLDQKMWDGFRDIVVASAAHSTVEPTAAVLFACDVGQRSWEWSEKGHSVFNYYLVESFGKAAEANGDIEFTGVASYVQRQMEEWTRRNRERPQRPIYEAKGGARLLLGKRPPGGARPGENSSTSIAVELAFWNAIANRGTPELYREYLNRYPQGQFSVIARAWLNTPVADKPQSAPAPSSAGEAAKPAREPDPKPVPEVIERPAPPEGCSPPLERPATASPVATPISPPTPPAAPRPQPTAPSPAPPPPLPKRQTMWNPAPGTSSPLPAPRPIPTAGPTPPKLHWATTLVLSLVTYGLFYIVWIFIQSRFVKRIDPRSKATRWFVFWLFLCAFAAMAIGAASESNDSGAAGFAILLISAAFLMYIAGVFRMRQSIERYYNSVEPIGLKLSGPLTFFFHIFYFQYHFHRIAGQKRVGVVTA